MMDWITADAARRARFASDAKRPRSVIVMRIAETCCQCARALQRRELWTAGTQSEGLPSPGDMPDDAARKEINGPASDTERATRANLGRWQDGLFTHHFGKRRPQN